MTHPDALVLADLRAVPAAPADLDLVELVTLGAPIPALALVEPSAEPLLLEDPEHTPVAILRPGAGEQGVEERDGRLPSLEPEAFLAHVLGVEEALEGLRCVQPTEDVALLGGR